MHADVDATYAIVCWHIQIGQLAITVIIEKNKNIYHNPHQQYLCTLDAMSAFFTQLGSHVSYFESVTHKNNNTCLNERKIVYGLNRDEKKFKGFFSRKILEIFWVLLYKTALPLVLMFSFNRTGACKAISKCITMVSRDYRVAKT